MIKKILLSVGLFVFGLQADNTFLHNRTPFPIKLQYNYWGWSFVCENGPGTITAGPNGDGSSNCGILNVRTHYTVWAQTKQGGPFEQVISQGASDGGEVTVTVYTTMDPDTGKTSFHLTTGAFEVH